jgi:hypothetical protein
MSTFTRRSWSARARSAPTCRLVTARRWLAAIPGVNYGIFTNEADAAVIAQIPALKDGGDIDAAIAAIDTQVRQQIQ